MSEGNDSKQGTFWDVPPEKRCGRCKQMKPLTEFGRVKGKIRSYCRECHQAYMRNPDLRAEKKCARCKEVKSVEKFHRCGKRFHPYCKTCSRKDARQRYDADRKSGRAQAKWREYYDESRRWVSLKSKYGITKEEYLKLEEQQDGKCAICKRPETDRYKGRILDLAVDHDHRTGKVRGLLCRSCNLAIGKFRDDIKIVEAALRYMRGSL